MVLCSERVKHGIGDRMGMADFQKRLLWDSFIFKLDFQRSKVSFHRRVHLSVFMRCKNRCEIVAEGVISY